MMRWQGLVLGAGITLTACDEGTRYLPDATGAQGEVLVVMDHAHWEGPPGQAVREVLESSIPGLPQREPRFKVAQSGLDRFGNLLRNHHNILLVEIGGQIDSTGLWTQRDRHARGQLLMHLMARDPMEAIEIMHDRGTRIGDLFDSHERDRVRARLATERDLSIATSVEAAMGVRLHIPKGYRVVKQEQHMAWLQRDRIVAGGGLEHNVIEGLLVYSYPYTSDSTFTVPYLVDKRDEFTKRHVEGPDPGSYMITQRSFEYLDLMPQSRQTEVNSRFAFEMRGLFGMHGAKMGGPFISVSVVDESRGRVLTVEGFVYAPQFNKREYIREMEGILHSLRIVDEPSS